VYQYNSKDSVPDFKVRLIASTSARSHYGVIFATPLHTNWKEGNTVYGDLFVPQNVRKAPLAIVAHGFGDESIAPCITLARLLCRQGIASFVLYLPVHSRRLPEKLKGKYFPPNPRAWLDVCRGSVMEIRRIIDWASCQEGIDVENIIVVGISLGGIISSIALALDSRITAGIFITIGGNGEELSWGGTNIPVGHECTREECHAVYSRYPAYLTEVTEKGLDNVVPARECFLFDPVTFAGYLKERRILMLNGSEDDVVSQKATFNLWEAYGKPKLVWLPGSHTDAYSNCTAISAEITCFLNSVQARR
jgi:hypothetical protein